MSSIKKCTKQRVFASSKTPTKQGPKQNPPLKYYKPFLSKGRIAINAGCYKLIQILRDMGAFQTLLLQGALPLSKATFTGNTVLLQGVELGTISAPLYHIHIESDLVTGPVIVGIQPTLPIKGISMILGYNLAGGRIRPDPNFTNLSNENNDCDEENQDLYLACAVTQAMQKDMLRVMQKMYRL